MMIVMAAELYARSEINFEKLKRASAELNEKRIQAENAAALSFIQRMRQKAFGNKEIESKSKDDQPQRSKGDDDQSS
jgi:hypothetical protein